MSTGQTCTCGASLPATWPHADAYGRAVCLGCLSHEQAATWPAPGTPGPEASLSIARPQAYGREGRR